MSLETLLLTFLGSAMAIVAINLAIFDMRNHRLPNSRVGLLSLLAAITIHLLAFRASDMQVPVRAIAGALGLALFYAIVRLVSNGGLGMGDVKLALPLGALTSALGWPTLLLAFAISSISGGIGALAVLMTNGSKRKISYGPHMLLGAATACLLYFIN